MKRHRPHFLSLLLLYCAVTSLAQSNVWTLRGKVMEPNRTPLEFVNVYVNNTSIGTTTKTDGSFILKIPKSVQKIEVVVSFIGYNTLKKVLTPTELSRGVVFLLESSTLLNEVKITARRDKDWKKKWRIFREGLLGISQFTEDCEILNPEAIRLEYDKDKNVVATANEPIFIENKGLGYKIMFQMETFISDGKLTFFAGDKFFEHLKPRDERQENRWKKFRRRAYNNSFRNFLVTLAQNKLADNGFEVFQQTAIREAFYGRTSVGSELKDRSLFKCIPDSICSYDSLSRRYTLHSEKPLLVFLLDHFNPVPVFKDYPYKYSQIALPKGSFEFTANGWITKPNGLIIRDHWGNEGFSSLLPDDYEEETIIEPNASPEVLAGLYSENERKYWFINGRVVAPGGIPLADANVFVNNSENGVKTNNEGKFLIKVPTSLQKLELLVTIPKFLMAKESVSAKENTEIVEVSMKPDNFAVSNEKDKDFQKNWKVFEKALLGDPYALVGKTQFPESCEIVNPEVVSFEKDEGKFLIAKAVKPLIVLNNALGYKITYQLNYFENDSKKSQIAGDKYFEKLTPKDDKQKALWEKNQLKIYQESLKYFLISLSQNKLEQNGFVVFKMRKIQDIYDLYVTVKSQLADSSLVATTATELCKFDAQANRFYMHSDYPLLVFLTHRTEAVRLTFKDYPYKRSQIVLPNFYLEFAADGTVTNYQNAEMRDFWGNEGLSSDLPKDFSIDQQNMDRINFEAVEVISPKSVSFENINKNVINGIQFNRTIVEQQETKVFGSVPTDFDVRISDNDVSFTVYDLLRRIPGMIIKFQPKSGQYFIGFSGNATIQNGAQPAAVVIDGYFIDDQEMINVIFNSMSVSEIATLGAIKYGNAAIYGARGANGIIVITTKK